MSLLLAIVASALIAVSVWLGLRRRFPAAILVLAAALAPLLVDLTVTKAIFVWLGLIGPIAIVMVMLMGLHRASD